ncbi:MAG: chemotaxis protein MotC, partial [Mesorhizobium sp.]
TAQAAAEAQASAPAQPETPSVPPASTPAAAASLDPHDPTDAAMLKARRQLDQIDQLLGAAPK